MQFYEFTLRIPRPDRQWLRFSLRTALLLFLLAAMFLGGMMVGIRYERNGFVKRRNSERAGLEVKLAELQLALKANSRLLGPSHPEIRRLEQEVDYTKARLKQLR